MLAFTVALMLLVVNTFSSNIDVAYGLANPAYGLAVGVPVDLSPKS